MNWNDKYHQYINSRANIDEFNRRLEEGMKASGEWPGWEAIWDREDLHPAAGRISRAIITEQVRRFFSDPENYKNRKKIKALYQMPFAWNMYYPKDLVEAVEKEGSLDKIAFIVGYHEAMEKMAASLEDSDKDVIAAGGLLGGVIAGQIPLKAYVNNIMRKGVSSTDLATARRIAKKYNLKIDYNRALPPHYNPITKKIFAGHGLAGTLHELGHARVYKRLGSLGQSMAAMRMLAPLSTSLAGTAMALSDNEETAKSAPLVAMAGGIPVLLDEGIASGLALKELKKLHGWGGVGQGIKKLTPGFLSYLSLPAIAAVLPFLARGIKRKINSDEYPELSGDDASKNASQGYIETLEKAAAIIAFATGYEEAMQKAAAKGLTTASHSELAMRPEVRPQKSSGPSISPSMGSLLGGSRSMASFAPAVAESTSTARPGSGFDMEAVRAAEIPAWTGNDIRAATPEEMLHSRSVMNRPWYNPQAPRTNQETMDAVVGILSNFTPGKGFGVKGNARHLEDFI